MFVSTTNEIRKGWKVKDCLGIVCGNSSSGCALDQLMHATRDALDNITDYAEALGANAVINLHMSHMMRPNLDLTNYDDGDVVTFVYGNAAVIEEDTEGKNDEE